MTPKIIIGILIGALIGAGVGLVGRKAGGG